MHLLHLPPELFRRIILVAAVQNGAWRKVTRLRLVCKAFDVEMQRAMYAAPPFPTLLLRMKPVRRIPEYMSHEMTRRLILSKMIREGALFSYTIMRGIDLSDMIRDDARKRPLCYAILSTLEYLDSEFHMIEPDWRRRCIEGLVTAVAMALPLKDIVRNLALPPHGKNYLQHFELALGESKGRRIPCSVIHPTPGGPSFVDTLRQDALISALITGQAELAKLMLDRGVDGTKESPIFGSPISVASYMGLNDIIKIIATRSLQQIEPSGNKDYYSNPVNDSSSVSGSLELDVEMLVRILPQVEYKTILYTPSDHVLHGAVLKNCARAVRSILPPEQTQDQLPTLHDTFSQPLSCDGIEEAIFLALRYKQHDIVTMLIQYKASRHKDSSNGPFCMELMRRLGFTARKTLQETMDTLFQHNTISNPNPCEFPFYIHEAGVWGSWIDTVYPSKKRPIKKVFGVEVIQQLLSKSGEQDVLTMSLVVYHGADVNYKYPNRRSHPVVRAAATGNLYMMKDFVNRGMDFHNDHCASQALALAINITASNLQLESVQRPRSHFSHCINFLLHVGASAKEALDGSADGRPIPDFVKVDEGALAGLNYRTRTHIMRKYTESDQNTQSCA